VKTPSVVAVYTTRATAESVVNELQRSGVDLNQLSIIGRDYQTDAHVIGYYHRGDETTTWGQTGAFWGGIWSRCPGAAFFWVPGIGPLLTAGPIIRSIIGALEGPALVDGTSAIGGALARVGVSQDNLSNYETALKTGKYLLIVHGTPAECRKAQTIIERTGPEPI
jgi:uncharacterized membrane protein